MLLHKKLLFLFIAATMAVSAQQGDSLQTKRLDFLSDNKHQGQLDSLIERFAGKFMQNPPNCGISIGISKDGVINFYNYGEIKRNSKTLPTSNTIYEIGSMTAAYCGILLAQAVVDHKLTLDDDIRNYLPGKYPYLKFDDTPILVKHLANHTSGLPNVPENLKTLPGFDSLNPYKHYEEQGIYNYLREVNLRVEPGTAMDYSNLGITVLGLILETVYNKPFEDLVREKICVPNNLTNTGFVLNNAQLKESASGYNQDGKPTPAWDLGSFNPAGGLKSTSGDMLSFLDYNLRETDAAARLSHVPAYKDRQTLGLGWFIKLTKQNNTLVWLNGATYGFSSFGGFIKEKKCSVIVMANSATNVEYIGIALLNYLQQ